MRRRTVSLPLAILIALAPCATALAAPDGAEAEKRALPKASEKARAKVESPYAAAARAARQRAAGAAITTEDLERLSKHGTGFSSFNYDPDAGVDEDGARSLEYLDGLQRREAAGAEVRAAALEEVEASRRAVRSLEQQLLSAKNPFAARGEVSEDEKLARAQDASVAARVARIERQLAEARQELAAAERGVVRGASGVTDVEAVEKSDPAQPAEK